MTAAAFEITHEWEEPQELQELLQTVREYRPDADLKRIRFAYYIAEKAHSGQIRESDSGPGIAAFPLDGRLAKRRYLTCDPRARIISAGSSRSRQSAFT